MRALKVSYSDVGEEGDAVNCKKTQFFMNTLYILPTIEKKSLAILKINLIAKPTIANQLYIFTLYTNKEVKHPFNWKKYSCEPCCEGLIFFHLLRLITSASIRALEVSLPALYYYIIIIMTNKPTNRPTNTDGQRGS